MSHPMDMQYQEFNKAGPQNRRFTVGEGFLLKYICCCGPPIRYIVTAAAVLLSTVLLVALTVLVLKYENRISNSPVVPPETVMGQTGATNFTLSGKLRIMQRKEWLAQPLAAPLPILTTPVPYVIISHTATEQCLKIAECILQVRTVQTFHIESRGWWDIGYNFLVGGDGFAYTGRGWDTIGAHAYGYNNVSIGISFIGTFNTVLPPARQLTAAKQLIELGVKLGKISENYKLLGHKQVSATESPGNVLYQELQKWPHWSEHP
ncbi:Peptidoglycan-recognition protein LA [Gryllus bimaculatus]|nr:Peptidoglycan-recognition protein LA [Gryllus bimaculatus]